MSVSELKFLSEILSPGWIDFNLVGHQWAFEERVPKVRSNNCSSLVESLHSSLTSLNVLSVLQKLLIYLINCQWVSLHLANSQNPKSDKTHNHGLRHGGEVSNSLPVNVTGWILNESQKVFEASLFVCSVDTLSAESVFFKLPIVLFSDRSEWIREGYL